MANSINTNAGALVALRNLNQTNSDLDRVQNRVSTGMRVASALDDGGAFAVAQGLRADMKATSAVNEQLAGVKGLLKVSSEASKAISDKLGDLKALTEKLADASLSTDARAQYTAQFTSMMAEIDNYAKNATFRGTSLITTNAANVSVIATLSGSSYSVSNQTAALVSVLAVTTNSIIAVDAGTVLTKINNALSSIGTAMNTLASDYRRIEGQMDFNSAVLDATEEGLGAIVDADLAKESARLQALQIKQQLAGQALGIANQSPQAILSLFR